MPAFTAIGISVATGLSIAGAAAGAVGTGIQAIGQRKQAAASKRAEKVRLTLSNLESVRERRRARRQAAIARGTAVSNATNQGAELGSGLSGGLSQISAVEAGNLVGISQQQQATTAINRENNRYASAGGLTSVGGGLSSLGGAIYQNAGTIGNITTELFGSRSPVGGLPAQ